MHYTSYISYEWLRIIIPEIQWYAKLHKISCKYQYKGMTAFNVRFDSLNFEPSEFPKVCCTFIQCYPMFPSQSWKSHPRSTFRRSGRWAALAASSRSSKSWQMTPRNERDVWTISPGMVMTQSMGVEMSRIFDEVLQIEKRYASCSPKKWGERGT